MPCPSEPLPPQRWRIARAAVEVVAIAFTAGCAQLPPPAVPPGPAPVPTTSAPRIEPPPMVATTPTPTSPPVSGTSAAGDPRLQDLLDLQERTRSMSPAELTREQARLSAAGDGPATLQLAWLLAQGRTPGDLARAQALLDPLARGEGAEAQLARLLQARLAEQRRLEDQLERQAQQQRELQRRNEQLREQLDALRAIERSLGPRPPASAPRTP